jgi:hypothetical protein
LFLPVHATPQPKSPDYDRQLPHARSAWFFISEYRLRRVTAKILAEIPHSAEHKLVPDVPVEERLPPWSRYCQYDLMGTPFRFDEDLISD